MKSPTEIFTEETFKFVTKYIDPVNQRILEVGCGHGDFGIQLKKAGAKIIAIDSDEEAIKVTLGKGLNAKCMDFLEFEDASFDTIIFTRSLHHIHKLREALEHAKSLLKPEGKLLLEEFAFENIDYKTTRWYYDMLSLLSIAGLTYDSFEDVKNPIEKWEEDHFHEHTLNSGELMTKEVGRLFGNVKVERVPYLYRSICGCLSKDERAFEITKQIFEIEKRLIQKELILPNGLRILAEG